MRSALVIRTIRLIVTLFAVTFLTSIMLDLLPGDPAVAVMGADNFVQASPEALEEVHHELGLDQPVIQRYGKWLSGAVTGDFGRSFRTRQPVSDAIVDRLPVTLELLVLTEIVSLGAALLIAPLAALRPGKWFDRATTTLSFALLSVPSFVGGLILIYIMAVRLHLLPATGFVPLGDSIVDNLRSLVLPALTLGAGGAAVYTRVLRAEMISTLQEDYILTARAKGLSTRRLLMRHALRPSSLPLLTLIGINVGLLIGGAVIVEPLFGLPGLGRLTIDSITNRDYLTVQGIVAILTVGYVVINYIVDVVYLVADPRIRHATH
jgi:peptide/nickel transport system permease protein